MGLDVIDVVVMLSDCNHDIKGKVSEDEATLDSLWRTNTHARLASQEGDQHTAGSRAKNVEQN